MFPAVYPMASQPPVDRHMHGSGDATTAGRVQGKTTAALAPAKHRKAGWAAASWRTVLQVLDALVLDLKLEGVDEERGVVQHVDGRYVDGCHPPRCGGRSDGRVAGVARCCRAGSSGVVWDAGGHWLDVTTCSVFPRGTVHPRLRFCLENHQMTSEGRNAALPEGTERQQEAHADPDVS